MRKIVMMLLAGGSLLWGAVDTEAGVLTGIRTVGSGLNAKVEVASDATLTYVFFRNDASHWVIDLAKTEPGSIESSMDLGIPAVTGLTAEKRQAGSIAITRLTLGVRPGVSLQVKPSADRKLLTLSFQSGAAPASTKEDDLLGDLDAPAKPARGERPAAAKDDLDSLLDAPVTASSAAATVAAAKANVTALDDELGKDLAMSDAPQVKVPAAKSESLPSELDDLKESAPLQRELTKQELTLDREIARSAEPSAAAPAKSALVPVVPEMPVAVVTPKSPSLPVPVGASAALPAGVDLGALTPDELGIASPELEMPIPVEKPAPKVEVLPATKVEVEPEPKVKAESLKEAPIAAAEVAKPVTVANKASGSLKVEDTTAEILVENFTTYKAFTLMEPTRVVIDFSGAKASLKEAAAKARMPGIQAVRFSQYPDKVRIVFDLPKGELPAYKIEKLDSGIRISFK